MNRIVKLMVPLSIAATLGAGIARADDYRYHDQGRSQSYDRAPAPPRVTFTTAPTWVPVSGSRVYVVRSFDRPEYDYFRMGSSYYIYSDGYWYRANSWNGPFATVQTAQVPRAIFEVPASEWRSYPTDGMGYVGGTVNTPRVTFRTTPRWMQVPGTGVYMVTDDQRPDYDLFRVGSSYYVYEDGRWFRASRWSGPYAVISSSSVPRAITRVPEVEWRSYPTAWSGRYDRGHGGYDRGSGSAAMNAPNVHFRTAPRWVNVRHTNVYVVRQDMRPDYDLFRYRGTYYVYSDGHWYTSRSLNGTYVEMSWGSVPMAFRNVPEPTWRSYPEEWGHRTYR